MRLDFSNLLNSSVSRGSEVGIVIGYGPNDWGVGVRVPVGSRILKSLYRPDDRLCGLVVRFLSYRSGGQGSIPGTIRKKVVCLEGPLSLVSTTEELHDGKVASPVQKTENTAVGIRHADHVAAVDRSV
jgi:hypothetical protein